MSGEAAMVDTYSLKSHIPHHLRPARARPRTTRPAASPPAFTGRSARDSRVPRLRGVTHRLA